MFAEPSVALLAALGDSLMLIGPVPPLGADGASLWKIGVAVRAFAGSGEGSAMLARGFVELPFTPALGWVVLIGLFSQGTGIFGALVLLPIYPRATASAHRLILSGTKGSRAPSNIRPSLILHGDDGRFLPEVNAILREGAALPL